MQMDIIHINMLAPTKTVMCVCYYYSVLFFFLVPFLHNAVVSSSNSSSPTYGSSEIVYQWTTLELDWPSPEMKRTSLQNGSYVPDRNLVAGIKLYKNEVYLTIPRWQWNDGQPATLVKVVKVGGQDKLRPYPDWASQRLGDCNSLQYVQSMEIDPNTGYMYVIDTGRTGLAGRSGAEVPRNRCPAKIVVYDLNTDRLVDRYELPGDVVSRTNNFINDLVLDYVNNKVRFAYVTDVAEGKLYVVDLVRRSAYFLEDQSMKPEGNNRSVITINRKRYPFPAGVDGIAMSSDFRYVYYCPLGGYNLYQIPTQNLRQMTSNIDGSKTNMGIRLVGSKLSQSDGLIYGNRHRLYFGALAWNAVYQWDLERDAAFENLPIDQLQMYFQTKVTRHDRTMQWVDTLAFGEDGWLWFVSNKLQLFATGTMDFSGLDADGGANVRVWKVYVNDTSYLHGANRRTGINGPTIIG